MNEVIDLNEINNIKVDNCIICSHSRLGSFNKISEKITAKNYYYWCHLLMFEMFPNLEFEELLIDNVKNFICVSESVKNDIMSKYPHLEKKCIVIENYLDFEEIHQKSNEHVNLAIDEKKLNIISVSRIAKDKRIW